MEISDCIWDEDFLCVEELDNLDPSLVSTSIPSPGLVPFQWSDKPLADEADNSDMTPQCMPVIDPNFVREHFIEDCVIDGVSDVMQSGDDVLAGYLADQESSEQFGTLHVLVCGLCHSVFHILDEFKSHLFSCDGRCKNSQFSSYESTSAVALVLWTNTVMRRVQDNLGEIADHVQVSHRIQSKWWRLSKRSRQVWEKAAEVLRELAKVGSLVFPATELRSDHQQRIDDCVVNSSRPPDDQDGHHQHHSQQLPVQHQHPISTQQPCTGDRVADNRYFGWPGPHDFVEADEIEMLGRIKVEQEEASSPIVLQRDILADERDESISNGEYLPSIHNGLLMVKLNEVGPSDSKERLGDDNIVDSHFNGSEFGSGPGRGESVGVRVRKKRRYKRDRKGRWDFLEYQEPKPVVYSCNPCQFKTDNPWKMDRHEVSQKHKLLVDGIALGNTTPSVTVPPLVETPNALPTHDADPTPSTADNTTTQPPSIQTGPDSDRSSLAIAGHTHHVYHYPLAHTSSSPKVRYKQPSKKKKVFSDTTLNTTHERTLAKRQSAIHASERVQKWTNLLARRKQS